MGTKNSPSKIVELHVSQIGKINQEIMVHLTLSVLNTHLRSKKTHQSPFLMLYVPDNNTFSSRTQMYHQRVQIIIFSDGDLAHYCQNSNTGHREFSRPLEQE